LSVVRCQSRIALALHPTDNRQPTTDNRAQRERLLTYEAARK